MKIHPVFHNSLLKPYYKTKEHSPNHEKPAPEIVDGEEGHYEIETILMAWPTCNKKSMQYLIKWKGYPASENLWLPEKELTSAKELLDRFKQRHASKQRHALKQRPNILGLQAQQKPKEGILLWTASTTSSITSSKSKVPQVNPMIRPAHDPEKQGAHANSSGDLITCDQTRNKSPDTSCALTHGKSQDLICFGQARSPLINRWQTIGMVYNQRRHVILAIG
jgi:hypothetical protein